MARPAPTPGPPRIISEASPLTATCGKQPGGLDSPGEPSLAVDPADARHLVATWIQDHYPDQLGNVAAVSRDGGSTWNESTLPGFTPCTGGIYRFASDPWVSIGSDGTAYLSSLVHRHPDPSQPNIITGDVIVSVSRDGGSKWDRPAVVVSRSGPPAIVDKEAILADPHQPGTAYLVWVEYAFHGEEEPSIDQVYFARTRDRGRTWSEPSSIYSAGDEAQQNELLAVGDGSLLDVFVEGSSLPGAPHPPPLPVRVRVLRSTDQGQTWSSAVTAASFTYTNAVDPENGSQLRFFGQDISAAAGAGSAYVAWFEVYPQAMSSIWVARSTDGGRSWGNPSRVVTQRPELFLPTLAVAGDGTVGLLWYDVRNFKAGGTALDTDVWFSRSHDHGLSWQTVHLAGSFNLRAAPLARYGPFIGDYEGLAGLPTGFAAAFVQAEPQSRHGLTDVFFSKIP